MVMIDILSAGSGVVAWLGSIVVYWLFRAQGDGEWSALKKIFFWVAVSWTVSMAVETLHFSSKELSVHIPGLTYFITPDYQAIRKVTTWPLQAWAYWAFIVYLLRPKEVPSVAIAEAQIEMDALGIITDWNTAATNLLGWTAAQATHHEMASLIIPEDLMIKGQSARELHRAGLKRFRDTGVAPMLNTHFPTFAMCKNGKQIPIDLRVTGRLSAHEVTFVGQLSPRSVLQASVPSV